MRIRIAHIALGAALFANLILINGCGKTPLDRRIFGQIQIKDKAGNRVPLMISQIRIVPASVAEENISQWQRWSALQMIRALEIQPEAAELEAHAKLRAKPDLRNSGIDRESAAAAKDAVDEIKNIVASIRAYRDSKAPLGAVSLFQYLTEHLNSEAIATANADSEGKFTIALPPSPGPVALITEASELPITQTNAYVWIIQVSAGTNDLLLNAANSAISGSSESLVRAIDVPSAYAAAGLLSAEHFKAELDDFHHKYADWLQSVPHDPMAFISESSQVYAQVLVRAAVQTDGGVINLNVGDYIHIIARNATSAQFELNGKRAVVPLSAINVRGN